MSIPNINVVINVIMSPLPGALGRSSKRGNTLKKGGRREGNKLLAERVRGPSHKAGHLNDSFLSLLQWNENMKTGPPTKRCTLAGRSSPGGLNPAGAETFGQAS